MGQLLRYRFRPPKIGTWDLWRYMVTDFVDEARRAMRDGGFLQKRTEGDEVGGGFLVGVRGQLFEVESDFQVGVPADGYAACGCGASIALGAMHALHASPPRLRVTEALRAAERHSAGVRSPFLVECLEAVGGGS